MAGDRSNTRQIWYNIAERAYSMRVVHKKNAVSPNNKVEDKERRAVKSCLEPMKSEVNQFSIEVNRKKYYVDGYQNIFTR